MCGSFFIPFTAGGIQMEHNDEWYMHKAMTAARWAAQLDEVPVGCVIVKHDKIIAWGWNSREETQDPTGHAEIMAIRKAAEYLGSWRLDDCTMYVTLEPCCMCAGALVQSRVSRVVFGASDPKGGCVGSCLNVFSIPEFNHHPAVDSGCLQTECGTLLRDFFRQKRQRTKQKKKT